jgi:hypothetical protein
MPNKESKSSVIAKKLKALKKEYGNLDVYIMPEDVSKPVTDVIYIEEDKGEVPSDSFLIF